MTILNCLKLWTEFFKTLKMHWKKTLRFFQKQLRYDDAVIPDSRFCKGPFSKIRCYITNLRQQQIIGQQTKQNTIN